MTWTQIKPVIQGKILYGPNNTLTDEIMTRVRFDLSNIFFQRSRRISSKFFKPFQANDVFTEIRKLYKIAVSLNKTVDLLRNDEEFQSSVENLFNLARTPFVQNIIGDKVDVDAIELIFKSINDGVSH